MLISILVGTYVALAVLVTELVIGGCNREAGSAPGFNFEVNILITRAAKGLDGGLNAPARRFPRSVPKLLGLLARI